MMTFLGYGIRVTDAIFADHIMVNGDEDRGGYLFFGRSALFKLREVMHEQHSDRREATYALRDAMERSQIQHRSVQL